MITIEQSMTNRGEAVASWGLWDVTQVRGPGFAVLPIARDSALPSGLKAYANEGRSPEAMAAYVTIGADAAIVTCAQVEPFKYGTDSSEGWICGLVERGRSEKLGLLKAFEVERGGIYPHGTTVEVFDSGKLPYLEIEVHSPVVQLDPGQSYFYVERWLVEWVPDAVEPQEWARGRITGAPNRW